MRRTIWWAIGFLAITAFGHAQVGSITDPTGDVPSGVPDITGATGTLANGVVTLSVSFAPGTLTSTTRVEFNIDRNRNGIQDLAAYIRYRIFGGDAEITNINAVRDPIDPVSFGYVEDPLVVTANSLTMSFPASQARITEPFWVSVSAYDPQSPNGNDITGMFGVGNIQPPGNLTILSGDHQTATQNMPFALPLIVQVSTSAGLPLANCAVDSRVTGPVTLSASSAATDANGRAQFVVQAGSTVGTATVTVSLSVAYSVTFTLAVVPPGQTISFGALNNVPLGTPPFTISATASSGLPVTFASTTPTVCTVSGSTVTILAPGTCSITASQAGNASFAPATPVTQSFAVSNSGSAGVATYTYHGNPFTDARLPFTTSNSITGSVTLSAALPPDLPYQEVTVSSFSFSDGINTWDQTNSYLNTAPPSLIGVSTDAHGAIDAWTIVLVGDSGLISGGVLQTVFVPGYGNNGDMVANLVLPPLYGASHGYNGTTPGTWVSGPSVCNVTLAPGSQLISATGGTGNVGVLTGSGCQWAATSTAPFLAITSGTSGTGPGTVQFTATANAAPAARTGALTIGGQTATVNQAGTAPVLLLSPTSLSIQWVQQSSLPATIPLSIFTAASSLNFSAVASSSGNWLSVSPTAGSAPSTLFVSVNPSSLQAGTYQGTVTVTAPVANPSSQSFTVSLAVIPAGSPTLSVATKSLNYAFDEGAKQVQQRRILIGNSGSGTLHYQASASTSDGGNWLSIIQDGAGATLAAPDPLTVTVNPGGLPAGTYTGAITIKADSTWTIPVTVTVNALQQTIVLLQTGLTFTAVENGGAVPAQTFGVLNGGIGTMDWSATSSILTGDSNWLSITPNSGSADASSASFVTVSVNPANLPVGQYSGQIQVTSVAANNSPQFVSVILNVLPAGSNPGPVVLPAGLIFTQAAGGAAPGSQTITLSNLTGSQQTFTTGKLTVDGANWFSVAPAGGTLTPAQAATLAVSVNSAGLSPAIRRGVLTLFFQDGSIRTVNILYLLPTGGASAHSTSGSQPMVDAGSCIPSKLLPLVTSLGAQFAVPAAWPNTLAAQVVDDCGNPHVSGTVTTTFSNGDPPVQLTSLKNGNWTGTWQVRNTNAPVVVVTMNADNPTLQISGSVSVSGGLQSSAVAPVMAAGGVLNAASYVLSAPLSPGAMISIFGSNLANGTSIVSTFPLPLELSGTQVMIGGKAAPLLYAGSGQINAIIPYGLPVNTNTQVIVRQGTAYTAPEPIILAAADPAIFTQSGSGSGQGVIIRPDGNYAQPGTPAEAGDEIVLYAGGLGDTKPEATDGQAAPVEPLLWAAGAYSLTIGGQNARVDYAGMVPGYTGFYQINASVPAGVHGDKLAVILTVAGQSSSVVTMAVQ